MRTHEFGLRAALGAGRADIIRLVLREDLVVNSFARVDGHRDARLLIPSWRAAKVDPLSALRLE